MIKQRTLRGFSLLELIVSLLVLGILTVASVPIIRHFMVDNRIKAAAENFAEEAHLARSESISRQENIYLVTQSGASWCYGVHAGGSCSCSPTNTCTLGWNGATNYPGVTLSTTGFTGGSIYFDSVRSLSSEASEAIFQSGGKSITVKISLMGQVALCSDSFSGYPSC